MAYDHISHSTTGASLGEILERVLDKGVVIAGDISISLVEVELLTIKVRLVVASVERAMEMGIDWWRHDPMLSSLAAEKEEAKDIETNKQAKIETDEILERLERLEGINKKLLKE
ncbi:gas vesicle protein [Natroniella sulfidigena]|uniref:gas vesicle protein n=1 Tax=Natroniella sulfidigena TaxID=723921 RepID=UPI00200B4DB0|nr:gas vesicle protein [Natroniella sulfidigena]MCK8817047.1 gas vesicle protein [Natroniella sulfidigena]